VEYSALNARWWTTQPGGTRVWFDEYEKRWRAEDDEPRLGPASWSVILHDVRSVPMSKIAKLVNDSVPERWVGASELEHPPTTLCTRVGFATAEGLRLELERAGAVCEVREDQ
jgi:hypothetical protein